MRSIRLFILPALCALFFPSCNSNSSPDPLLGSWHAYSAEEEGRDLAVNLDEIRFRFMENGEYTFESTLNMREAGRFQRRKDKLITQDTMQADAQPKTVQIARIVADTLVLNMEEGGKTRKLFLQRSL